MKRKTALPQTAEERLAGCRDELNRLYASLYGDDAGAFSYFCGMLLRS